MEIGSMLQSEKDLSAVEFGAGVWDMMAVEVNERWVAAQRGSAKRLIKKRERTEVAMSAEDNEKEEVRAERTDERSRQIYKNLAANHDIREELKVVGMVGGTMQIQVQEKFIGTVGKTTQVMSMLFQAAGVKKALAAVSKICKAGNIVQFGDCSEECL